MGQLMGIVGPLLLLGGAIFVVAKRCELLGLCGETSPDSGTTTTDDSGVTSGGVDETASNLDEQGNWAGGSSSKGCCTCQMQGDRVKCRKHGGAWFNPPAVNGVSNDQSVELSLEACNSTCGSSSTSPTDREKNEVQQVKCASGYSSVNGKCVKLGSNRSKGGAVGTSSSSRMSPKPASCPSGQVRNKLTGKCNTVITPATARYTYYPYPQQPRSYFVDPNYVRPFNLYHRIAN
jgi:hypothetical protein